jgi:hypothetical protein
MPLSNDECLAVVRQLRAELREAGRADIDENLSREFPRLMAEPRHAMVFYLKETIRALEGEAGRPYQHTLDLLRRHVHAETPDGIRGIKVMLSPREQELYGISEVALGLKPEMSEVIDGFRELLVAIMRDFDEERPQ